MPDPRPFSLHVRAQDTDVVIEVCGEVDLLTAPDVRACLEGAIEATGGDVVVDCGGVDFIDSSGLKELLLARGSLSDKGRRLYLDRVGPAVMRVLEVSGLDGHIALRNGHSEV